MPFLTMVSGIVAIEVQVKITSVGEQSRGILGARTYTSAETPVKNVSPTIDSACHAL